MAMNAVNLNGFRQGGCGNVGTLMVKASSSSTDQPMAATNDSRAGGEGSEHEGGTCGDRSTNH